MDCVVGVKTAQKHLMKKTEKGDFNIKEIIKNRTKKGLRNNKKGGSHKIKKRFLANEEYMKKKTKRFYQNIESSIF